MQLRHSGVELLALQADAIKSLRSEGRTTGPATHRCALVESRETLRAKADLEVLRHRRRLW
jgi:hypothetical protein